MRDGARGGPEDLDSIDPRRGLLEDDAEDGDCKSMELRRRALIEVAIGDADDDGECISMELLRMGFTPTRASAGEIVEEVGEWKSDD